MAKSMFSGGKKSPKRNKAFSKSVSNLPSLETTAPTIVAPVPSAPAANVQAKEEPKSLLGRMFSSVVGSVDKEAAVDAALGFIPGGGTVKTVLKVGNKVANNFAASAPTATLNGPSPLALPSPGGSLMSLPPLPPGSTVPEIPSLVDDASGGNSVSGVDLVEDRALRHTVERELSALYSSFKGIQNMSDLAKFVVRLQEFSADRAKAYLEMRDIIDNVMR